MTATPAPLDLDPFAFGYRDHESEQWEKFSAAWVPPSESMPTIFGKPARRRPGWPPPAREDKLAQSLIEEMLGNGA